MDFFDCFDDDFDDIENEDLMDDEFNENLEMDDPFVDDYEFDNELVQTELEDEFTTKEAFILGIAIGWLRRRKRKKFNDD